MDKAFVQSWLHQFNIYNYVILDDLSINIKGDVYLNHTDLREFPIQFNEISGSFICANNQLNSLKGAPRIVGNSFDCSNNQIISLVGGPKIVGKNYDFSYNQVSTLEGLPSSIKHDLVAYENPIVNFNSISQNIGKNIYIDYQTFDKLIPLAFLSVSSETRLYFHTHEELSSEFFKYRQKKYFLYFSMFKKKMQPFIEKFHLESIIINDNYINIKKNKKI
jgi:hypothetical protein